MSKRSAQEIEDGCSTIAGSYFDTLKGDPQHKRRCYNANTPGGCCMAICGAGYRCQKPAKYRLHVDKRKIDTQECSELKVDPTTYAIEEQRYKHRKTSANEAVIMVCEHHYESVKTGKGIWGAVISPALKGSAWFACTGIVTAAAVAAVGLAAGPIASVVGGTAVGGAVNMLLSRENVSSVLENTAQAASGYAMGKTQPKEL